MKRIYILFVALIITGSIMAQTPQSFKYQAVVCDAGGDLVADQAVGMQISILQGSTSGTAVYVETFTPTTNEFGLINLNIGAGTVVSGDFTTIDWSANTYFIKIEMDITGGTAYEEYGTSRLLSVPYALHAKTAANTFSGNYSDLSGTPNNVSTFTNDAGYLTYFTETDPLFGASVAAGITGADTTNWNNKLDSYTETDPEFTAWDKSTEISITENQISDLDHFTTADETDPVFTAWDKSYNDLTNKPNIIDSINTVIDTTTQFVRTEVDGDITNEIQDLSLKGNTLSLTNDATTVDLSRYLDNTDNQNLSNVLSESNDAGNANIVNLADPVNKQDAATKAYVDEMLIIAGVYTIEDYDGNNYTTVKIGNQVWIAENLKTTHYADGTPIQEVTGNTNWDTLDFSDEAYCWYYDDSASYAETYGALYTWVAAMNGAASSDANPSGVQGVCPDGWHLPSDAEWKELEMYLGMSQSEANAAGWRGTNEGSKLAGNESLWSDGNLDSDAEFGTSGFTALPGSSRDDDGTFFDLGNTTYFWSATENDSYLPWGRHLDYTYSDVIRTYNWKNYGFSVRCLKD